MNILIALTQQWLVPTVNNAVEPFQVSVLYIYWNIEAYIIFHLENGFYFDV